LPGWYLYVVNKLRVPLSKFKAAIFDMDGLMIDTEHIYWAVERAIAGEYGKTVSDQTLRKMMGRERLASARIFVEETGLPISTYSSALKLAWLLDQPPRPASTGLP